MDYLRLLTIIGLVINVIINIVYTCLYYRYIKADEKYLEWEEAKGIHRCTSSVILYVGLFTSFKFSRALYSKFYGFSFFKAKLTGIDKLFFCNVLTGISIFLTSILIIISASMTIYFSIDRDQLFISAIDILALSVLLILLMICETQKPEDFFEEPK